MSKINFHYVTIFSKKKKKEKDHVNIVQGKNARREEKRNGKTNWPAAERVRDAESLRRFSQKLSNAAAAKNQRVFGKQTAAAAVAAAGFGEQRNKLYGTYGPRSAYSMHNRISVALL